MYQLQIYICVIISAMHLPTVSPVPQPSPLCHLRWFKWDQIKFKRPPGDKRRWSVAEMRGINKQININADDYDAVKSKWADQDSADSDPLLMDYEAYELYYYRNRRGTV